MTEFFEFSIDLAKSDAGQVSSLFEDLGAFAVTVTSTDDEICFDVADPEEPDWQNQTLTALFPDGFPVSEIVSKIRNSMGYLPQYRHSCLQDADWESNWQASHKAIEIGDHLVVHPGWHPPPEEGRIGILIDPGLAFGTGSHETTCLCLESLMRMDLEGKSVLDFGCGSGILGILACKLGASHVIGIDIDRRAVDVTRENARINGVEHVLKTMTNETYFALDKHHSFDLVIANILSNTLVDIASTLGELAGDSGEILLSGILKEQQQNILSAYGNTFEFQTRTKNDWVLMSGKPKPNRSERSN